MNTATSTQITQYTFHEVANIFPMMSDEEFAALVEDIKANGQRQPIYTHRGAIVDGRNRYRACVKLGIEPNVCEWDGSGSLVSFVVSLNLQRRHLSPSQKATVAVDILPMLEEEAKERRLATLKQNTVSQIFDERIIEPLSSSQRALLAVDASRNFEPRSRDEGRAAEQAAQIVGTNRQYVHDAKRLKEESPALFEKVRSGDVSIPDAKKQVKREAIEAEREERAKKGAATKRASDRFELVCGPCIDIGGRAAESVDWIITDPPYPKEFLGVYDDLAEVSAHVLKPGGSLLCMIGQSYLPAIVKKLSARLSYHWALAYLTPGGQATQLFDRKVNTFWKPVLWFVKGEFSGNWIGDVTRSATNNNEKDGHVWQQSESGMADLMSRFVRGGDVVLDPFLGSGTTGAIALHMGCKFIGYDIDQRSVDISSARLAEVCNAS